ncbi:MAG: hypothetical protein ACOYM3_02405 [Terrimicrobiaceae bacterium]
MSEPVTQAPRSPAYSPWPVVGGTLFIIAWVLMALILFYLIFANGLILELLLNILRSVMVPGTTHSPRPEMLGWVPAMQAAIILAGAAGIPAGLAFFWRGRRKALLLGFATALVLGALCGIYAVYLLISSAITI